MLPNSVSGNGRTNQEVREVQSPGAGSAVVLRGDQAVKEAGYDNKYSPVVQEWVSCTSYDTLCH